MMLLLTLAVLASVSAAPPSVSFYVSNPETQQSQFYSGAKDQFVYSWGYNFPGRVHTEKKTHDGVVAGEYFYTDANGENQHVNYRAHPEDGFKATQRSYDGDSAGQGSDGNIVLHGDFPSTVFSHAPQPIVNPPQPVQIFKNAPVSNGYKSPESVANSPTGSYVQPILYSQDHFREMANNEVPLDVNSEQNINAASPEILRAVREGKLVPVTGFDNEIVFRIRDNVVHDFRGSVSALANYFDVDTTAPRHDQQIPQRPQATFYSGVDFPHDPEQEVRGLLDIEQFTDGPRYVLRIPKI